MSVLVSECGYTREQALDLPMGQIWQDYFNYLERQGAIEFVSDEDKTQINITEELSKALNIPLALAHQHLTKFLTSPDTLKVFETDAEYLAAVREFTEREICRT
jgi:hypothetical protein